MFWRKSLRPDENKIVPGVEEIIRSCPTQRFLAACDTRVMS
jgi:hypothetical protein